MKAWSGNNNGGSKTPYDSMGDHFHPLLENRTIEPIISTLWSPWLALGNESEMLTVAEADEYARLAMREATIALNFRESKAKLYDQNDDDCERLQALIGAIVAYRQALATNDEYHELAWIKRACAFLRLAGK